MKNITPNVIAFGRKEIPIDDVLEIRAHPDGYTEVWTKPYKCTTTVRELQDELARKKNGR